MKNKCPILQIGVPSPLRQLFDYLPLPETELLRLKPGMRVRVSFRNREVIGLFMGLKEESVLPLEKLKPIISVLDDISVIPEDILQLCRWAADYYHYPESEVLFAALPVLLRKGKPAIINALRKKLKDDIALSEESNFALNNDQQRAVQEVVLQRNRFQVFLLDGVTGSGKTAVYLEIIATILQQDKQVLVLLPEIGLTPQAIQRFKARFEGPVVALHSGLSEKERLNAWLMAKEGTAKIIIGTRSAIFSPFRNLGLIVVDEEHDLSFKQQEGFRYHARDIAIMRANLAKIPIVLGSATPALETLHNVKLGKFQHLLLRERANGAVLPDVHIIDICKTPMQEGLSKILLDSLTEHLTLGNQVMLFLNRRGFAPVLMCHSCGWIPQCKRCDHHFTLHQQPKRLHCHYCESQRKIYTSCEMCAGKEWVPIGCGTERLHAFLENYFSNYSVVRIDRDSTQRKGVMEKILADIQAQKHHVLIGTQMIAKGHHFPHVTCVGIVDADAGFFSGDFRALERMGQLLVQVSGRAGRTEKKGKVFVQTHHPDHPLLHQLIHENYRQFANTLLKERELAILPPYSFLAIFRAEAYQAEKAEMFLQEIKNSALNGVNGIKILGPLPSTLAKRAGRHRLQLIVQAKARLQLQNFLKDIMHTVSALPLKKNIRWSIDVDPLEIG